MAMGDPWIIGRRVHTWPFFGPAPCPVVDPWAIYGLAGVQHAADAGQFVARDANRDIGAELLQSALEAKKMLADMNFPCGWDERDALV